MSPTVPTTIGTIGSGGSASVDPVGRVETWSSEWKLDWWIGAEDKWHVPAETANVRQELIGDCPVVETRMRVPGGDIVHRTFVVTATAADGGGDLVIVDVTNDSAVPVALALSVATTSNADVGASLDNSVLRVDGSVAVLLPKGPNDTDVPDDVIIEPRPTTCAAYALPHGANLQVALPASRHRVGSSFPAAVPTVDQIVAGWRAQSDRGARFVLPDERLQSGVDVCRRNLLVRNGHPIENLENTRVFLAALDEFGFAEEVAEMLSNLLGHARIDGRIEGADDEDDSTGSALRAMARHWELTRDVHTIDSLQALVGGAANRISKQWRKGGAGKHLGNLRAVVALIEAGGDRRAGKTVTRWLDEAERDASVSAAESDTTGAFEAVDSMLSRASPTWTWPDHRPEDFLCAVRRMLIVDEGGHLVLCPVVPRSWLGQGVEVHDAPTRFGPVSFAVRWHGERPALLWDLDLHDGSDDVTITCPGLDPEWSTADSRGEALLEAPR